MKTVFQHLFSWIIFWWADPKINLFWSMISDRGSMLLSNLQDTEGRFVLWRLRTKIRIYLLRDRSMEVQLFGISNLDLLMRLKVTKELSRLWIGVLGKMGFWRLVEVVRLINPSKFGTQQTRPSSTNNLFKVRSAVFCGMRSWIWWSVLTVILIMSCNFGLWIQLMKEGVN